MSTYQKWLKQANKMGINSRQFYTMYSALGGIPYIGGIQSAIDSNDSMSDYMANYGIDYGSIKYPTRTTGYGVSSAVGSAFQVSRNVTRLYR